MLLIIVIVTVTFGKQLDARRLSFGAPIVVDLSNAYEQIDNHLIENVEREDINSNMLEANRWLEELRRTSNGESGRRSPVQALEQFVALADRPAGPEAMHSGELLKRPELSLASRQIDHFMEPMVSSRVRELAERNPTSDKQWLQRVYRHFMEGQDSLKEAQCSGDSRPLRDQRRPMGCTQNKVSCLPDSQSFASL